MLYRPHHHFTVEVPTVLRFAVLAGLMLLSHPAYAQPAAHPVPIVAAENFYGDLARQIGGGEACVTSILTNPDQDPHLFEVSPAVGRAVSAARIVIYNGIDYDPWMAKLLGAAHASGRRVIVVADLIGRRTGDNPHIWYDPATMLAAARALADALTAEDPAHKDTYAQRRDKFEASLEPVRGKIAALRQRLAGTPATATEPVFGVMFAALGMEVRNASFQRAVMNNTEPSASDIAAFEQDLRTHAVKLLVTNSQASDPVAARMERLARAAHIPVVGAAETEPPGSTYQAWMLSVLDAIDQALPARP
jgi:zinc/manganese transport system substrate-binding protein